MDHPPCLLQLGRDSIVLLGTFPELILCSVPLPLQLQVALFQMPDPGLELFYLSLILPVQVICGLPPELADSDGLTMGSLQLSSVLFYFSVVKAQQGLVFPLHLYVLLPGLERLHLPGQRPDPVLERCHLSKVLPDHRPYPSCPSIPSAI